MHLHKRARTSRLAGKCAGSGLSLSSENVPDHVSREGNVVWIPPILGAVHFAAAGEGMHEKQSLDLRHCGRVKQGEKL